MYEDFVMAGIGMESPLLEAKNQIFLGSESFVKEAMLHADNAKTLLGIPKAQKLAARPTLDDLFGNINYASKIKRNIKIKEAYDKHLYTLREIGQYLKLNPDYLSRLLVEMRKRSDGRP